MDKARGWDQLSIRMIKTCGDAITFPLKLIFKSMINKGVFPDDLKKSNAVPIHKNESKKISLKITAKGCSKWSNAFVAKCLCRCSTRACIRPTSIFTLY